MMDDYYDKLRAMKRDKLSDELERLYKRMMATNEASPIYSQLRQMLEMADAAYGDAMAMERHNAQLKQKDGDKDIIEIGAIESETYTPEYKDDEILTALVTAYTDKKDSKDA